MAERQSADLPSELLLLSAIAPFYSPFPQPFIQVTPINQPIVMIPQQDISGHNQNFYDLQKIVEEAVEYHLANGGAEAARNAIRNLAQVYFYRPDWSTVSCTAMNRINQFENDERKMEEQREQQRMQEMMRAMMGAVKPKKQKKKAQPADLPPELCTPFSMRIWKLLQEIEKVDENYQPLVSRTKAAVMAGWFFTQLDMDIQWPLFEKLWDRKSMRSDHSKAMKQKNTAEFQDELKRIEKKLHEEEPQVQLAAQLPRS